MRGGSTLIKAIRGAITVENDTVEEITSNTQELLKTLIERNQLDIEKIINISFTATVDLKSAYPAKAARELGLVDTPMLCYQEMYVKGALEKCIRALILVEDKEEVSHVYLKKAKSLRPDLN